MAHLRLHLQLHCNSPPENPQSEADLAPPPLPLADIPRHRARDPLPVEGVTRDARAPRPLILACPQLASRARNGFRGEEAQHQRHRGGRLPHHI